MIMKSAAKVTIVNMVVRSDFLNVESKKIDLSSLASSLEDWNGKYDAECFPSLFLKDPNGRATVLLFGSGKIIMTGIRSEREARETLDKLAERLKTELDVVPNKKYDVINVVARCDVDAEVDLDAAFLKLKNALYDPSLFPALIYRSKDPKFVALIFKNGKINVVGIKNEHDAPRAVELILDALDGCIDE